MGLLYVNDCALEKGDYLKVTLEPSRTQTYKKGNHVDLQHGGEIKIPLYVFVQNAELLLEVRTSNGVLAH